MIPRNSNSYNRLDLNSVQPAPHSLSLPPSKPSTPPQQRRSDATPETMDPMVEKNFGYDREIVIHSRMKKLEERYVEYKGFRIFIGSWNVNGQSATSSLGEHWLSCDPNPPDIYAIGFQELDLSKEAFLFSDTPKEEEWLNAVTMSLHPKANYIKLKLVRLIGMMLVVFIKRELNEHVTNVSACTVGTGILGKMGNKGGVAVRFNLHCTSICFVNSHLAAHQEECERRNQDFNEICNRTVFNYNGEITYIKNHDHIYWFGDLNYRINDLSSEDVKSYVDKKNFEKLIEHDQLRQQQMLRRAFIDFNEAPIKYQPTYKYDPGTDQWDSSEKNRPPAWCDRILWSGSGPTKCLVYRSHAQLKLSDHKPVSGLFNAQIKVINPEKHRKTYEEVIKQLDRSENDNLPQVTVDKMEIDYGQVRFREAITRYLTIANTGLATVRFEFINKPGHFSYCKPFLQIKPYTGTIEIGKKLDIQLELFVTEQTVADLNKREEQIDEILVLHLDRGKDIFITLNGRYVPSSFGASVESLIRLRDSVFEYGEDNFVHLLRIYSKPNQTTRNNNNNCSLISFDVNTDSRMMAMNGNENGALYNYPIDPCWDIPKEIWLLVNYLFKYGMDQEDLFTQPGLKSEFGRIREAVDTCNSEKIQVSIHSVAEALLIFLESLTEPIIPFNFYYKAIESVKNFALCKQIINEIPESHRRVFYYLISFMKELLKHARFNKLELSVLSSIFGRVLLRCPKEISSNKRAFPLLEVGIQSGTRNQAAFVYHFLNNDFDV